MDFGTMQNAQDFAIATSSLPGVLAMLASAIDEAGFSLVLFVISYQLYVVCYSVSVFSIFLEMENQRGCG